MEKIKVALIFLICLPLFFSHSAQQKENCHVEISNGLHGNYTLNLTVSYHTIDVKERRLTIGISAHGVGTGERSWSNVTKTLGFVPTS